MPPVSIMADDPFGQFGQLSLDPCAQQAPTARNDNHQSQTGIGAAPATPPHFPNSSVTATIDANTLGMGNPGLQHSNPQRQPQQQQPMQVSPEQPNVPAHATPGIMHQSQQGQQQQQQLVNSSYQNNPYAQPPPMQYQQTSMPYQQVNNGTTAMRVMSPPVSPLRPPPLLAHLRQKLPLVPAPQTRLLAGRRRCLFLTLHKHPQQAAGKCTCLHSTQTE